jgi:hypothetical protein
MTDCQVPYSNTSRLVDGVPGPAKTGLALSASEQGNRSSELAIRLLSQTGCELI